uniref:Uncharacterized protein n=1 Tax=Anopheles coluzzii TaxID=1518534 RepID=A0A8W7PFZ5_ANOCL
MPPLMGVTAPPPPPPDAQCCLPLNLFGSRMFSTEKANRFEAASLSVSRIACGFVSPPLSMERWHKKRPKSRTQPSPRGDPPRPFAVGAGLIKINLINPDSPRPVANGGPVLTNWSAGTCYA